MSNKRQQSNEKRVVHFLSGPYLSASSDWIYQQISNHSVYQPIVYCYGTKNLDLFPVNDLRSFNLFKQRTLFSNTLRKYYPLIYPYLVRDKPNIIHSHFGMSGYDFLHWKLLTHIPMITSFYGLDISSIPKNSNLWQQRYSLLFKYGNAFLVQGTYMKSSLRNLGCPAEKIYIHHLGVEIPRLSTRAKHQAGSPVRILIAGRFTEKKGFPDAVSAVGILKHDHPHLNIKLSIIGDASQDPGQQQQKHQINRLINYYGLMPYTTILGFQSYSAFTTHLENHDIFLSPSVLGSDGDNEGGSPMTILEASAHGLPIVSTYHCDIPEAVINSVSGFLVPEHRPDLLAKRLKNLVLHHHLRNQLGLAGRNHIDKFFNVKKQGKALEEIYQHVLDSSF